MNKTGSKPLAGKVRPRPLNARPCTDTSLDPEDNRLGASLRVDGSYQQLIASTLGRTQYLQQRHENVEDIKI